MSSIFINNQYLEAAQTTRPSLITLMVLMEAYEPQHRQQLDGQTAATGALHNIEC